MAKKSKKAAKAKSAKKSTSARAKKAGSRKKSSKKSLAKKSSAKKSSAKKSSGKKSSGSKSSSKRTSTKKTVAKKTGNKTSKKSASSANKSSARGQINRGRKTATSNARTSARSGAGTRKKSGDNAAWNLAKESLAAIGRAAARAMTPNPATTKPKRQQRDQPGTQAPDGVTAPKPRPPRPPRIEVAAQPTLFGSDASISESKEAMAPQAAVEPSEENSRSDGQSDADEMGTASSPARASLGGDDEPRPRPSDQDDMR